MVKLSKFLMFFPAVFTINKPSPLLKTLCIFVIKNNNNYLMSGPSIRAYPTREILTAFEKAHKENPHDLLGNPNLG